MTDEADYSEFAPSPDGGDMKALADLVKMAGETQTQIKAYEGQVKEQKALLKNLLEDRIPDLCKSCGNIESITLCGFTVELKSQAFAGIPSPSSIEREKDEDVRAELIERRNKALALLEEKAPALLKRSYEIEFDRDEMSDAERFEEQLQTLENPPTFVKGLTVHPKTLAKWAKELEAEGTHLSKEDRDILGILTRTVAKISQ
jgi:hypothetical protein